MSKKKDKSGFWQAIGLYGYLPKYKATYLPSLIALFLTAALSLCFPYLLGKIIAKPLAQQQDILARIVEQTTPTVIWLAVVLLLQSVIAYWRVRGFIYAGESVLNDIRKAVFDNLLKLPVSYFSAKSTAEITSSINHDLAILRDTLLTSVPQLARAVIILCGGIVFVFISSWQLALIMLTCLPAALVIIAVIGRKIKLKTKINQQVLTDSSVLLEEMCQNIEQVKVFQNEELEADKYQSKLQKFWQQTQQLAHLRATFIAGIIFILFGIITFVIWCGSYFVARGSISAEAFVHFIFFSVFISTSLLSLPEIIAQFAKTAGANDRIQAILKQSKEAERQPPQHCFQREIKFKDVSFSYSSRANNQVLKQLNFSLKKGQTVAIVGESGSGKTTLLRLLMGLFAPQQGTIYLDNVAIKDNLMHELRYCCVQVPQDIVLFSGSILENIRYGKPTATEEECIQAAKQAYAHDFIVQFQDGYDTKVGQRGTELSGGQRQRIAIARALLAKPAVLIFDEATSALDAESERYVQQAIQQMSQHTTCLIVAHRLSTVKSADQIFVMQEGAVVEEGTHQELLANKGYYNVLVETQLSL